MNYKKFQLKSSFLFIMPPNARLYAVGRGISASYEIFRPNAADWGERNLQYIVEPRLPYHSMLGAGDYSFLSYFILRFQEKESKKYHWYYNQEMVNKNQTFESRK